MIFELSVQDESVSMCYQEQCRYMVFILVFVLRLDTNHTYAQLTLFGKAILIGITTSCPVYYLQIKQEQDILIIQDRS